jgi:glucan 1,3-beta-glucosidase
MLTYRFILISLLGLSTLSFCAKLKLDKVRGVNLGGWLVLEPWITPSLFDQFKEKSQDQIAIDETNFHVKLGYDEAKSQLEKHWSEWVTEEDFRTLSSWGINLVRIPFGFWIFGDHPGMVSGLHHLDRGIDLAEKYNIQVLLDLHAVPGSQNGFDNSGTACANSQFTKKCFTTCPDEYVWHKTPEYVKKSQEILQRISERYTDKSNIYGIELLNEPFVGIDLEFMKNFYEETYDQLRNFIPSDWAIVMHDSFRPWNWEGFMADKLKYQNVFMDSHIYFAFDVNQISLSPEKILLLPCESQKQIQYMMQKQIPVFVGEWSLAKDDCALWLNGFMQATRKETILHSTCGQDYDISFMTKFIRNQLWAWEQSEGWIFWNFKANEDDWSFLTLIQKGVLPEHVNGLADFIAQSECITKNFSFLQN